MHLNGTGTPLTDALRELW